MTIDMHSHWRPPALIEALRDRSEPPRVVTAEDGAQVLRSRHDDMAMAEAFDDLDLRLADMDEHGVSTAALSLFGMFQWIERLPVEQSLPLVRIYNDSVGAICGAHPGRFVAFAALPLADLEVAVAEFDRAMGLPGMIGAQIPGNGFLDYAAAELYRPLLTAANRHRAILFIHWGPRPGDKWPRVPADADNMMARLGTLDMQASLSANMMTFSCTDILDDYPDASIMLHNLGGNIAFEIERLDHRSSLDTPDEPMPSTRFNKPNVFVDCNSFGPRAIEAGVAAYGAEKIVYGTDGTGFGCDWTNKALADARIDDDERRAILHDNAAGFIAHLAELAPDRAVVPRDQAGGRPSIHRFAAIQGEGTVRAAAKWPLIPSRFRRDRIEGRRTGPIRGRGWERPSRRGRRIRDAWYRPGGPGSRPRRCRS